jgi:hypothetical protein
MDAVKLLSISSCHEDDGKSPLQFVSHKEPPTTVFFSNRYMANFICRTKRGGNLCSKNFRSFFFHSHHQIFTLNSSRTLYYDYYHYYYSYSYWLLKKKNWKSLERKFFLLFAIFLNPWKHKLTHICMYAFFILVPAILHSLKQAIDFE